MADWKNQEPFRFLNYNEWVPDKIRFWIYLFFLIAFQFSNGFYFTTMAQLSGVRALSSEDTEMLGCAVLTGCAFFFPLAFRLKLRFTNKTSLTIAASVMMVVNILFPLVNSVPLMIILAYIGGFARLYGTFECFSNILPKITPTYNYGVFLSFVFFIVIGCIQLFDWIAIRIIYYYSWQHIHLMAIGLCLCVIMIVQTTMRHFRAQPKVSISDIDTFGMAIWSIFIISAIFVVIYGERLNWFTNNKIRIATGVSLIALAVGLLKMKTDKNAFIQSGIFTCPRLFSLLSLFLCFDILLASQNVLQNVYMYEVQHWGQMTSAELKLPEFIGGAIAALFCLFTRTRLHWRVKTLSFYSIASIVLYCLLMTIMLSTSTTIKMLWIPSIFIGFAHVAIFITLTIYAQANCDFKYYFQLLCVLGFVRMGIGDAIGSAIWEHLLSIHMRLEHLSFIGSLRELYGWATLFGITLLMLILLSIISPSRMQFQKLKH